MLLRAIYDERLASAAYLVGCEGTGEAILIDPDRDVAPYFALAARVGLKIVAAAETHIHADFASGARQLATEFGLLVYLPGEGGTDWHHQWPTAAHKHRFLRDGDTFSIGGVEFKALHTPGHTPEHLSYLVTDQGGGAAGPMGILTGDFLCVGDMGRPDLLESALGETGAAEKAARVLHHSLRKFDGLPDHLQVWPGHGAGSPCGKGLGGVIQSTLGYERANNAALRLRSHVDTFVSHILHGQPEPPVSFARLKQLNRAGAPVLAAIPDPPALSAADAAKLDGRAVAIVDTRPWKDFKAGHLPGSLHLPFTNSFFTDAGSTVMSGEPIYIVAPPPTAGEVVRALVRIGLDDVRGIIPPEALAASAGLATVKEVAPERSGAVIADPSVTILDVRRSGEFTSGNIPRARNIAHTRLAVRLGELPRQHKLLVHCRAGSRSAVACALLQRNGYDVTNLAGGYLAWEKAGKPLAG